MGKYKKEVALIGAGKIGKGYAADLFNAAGFKLIFLCHSLRQAEALRHQGKYKLYKYYDGEVEPREEEIAGFEAYSTEAEYDQCLDVLARVNYATVHLYPGAYQSVGNMLGDAVKRRMAKGVYEPLDVILCLNYIDPQLLFDRYIRDVLTTKEQVDYYEKYIGLVLALTFRWGANPRPYMLEADPLCSCVAQSPDLPVDRDAFKGEIPAEVALRPLSKMRERLAYKVWGGNVTHCMGCAMGHVMGYQFSYEADEDDYIYKCITLGTKEAHFGFDHEFNLTEEEKLENHRGRMGRRDRKDPANRARKDEVTRVAADPGRKLARRDRLIGPALSCIKNGKVPYFLTRAAAYYFYYVDDADPSAREIQAYLKENGIEKAIQKFCQLDLNDKYDSLIYQLVLAHYYELSEDQDVSKMNY